MSTKSNLAPSNNQVSAEYQKWPSYTFHRASPFQIQVTVAPEIQHTLDIILDQLGFTTQKIPESETDIYHLVIKAASPSILQLLHQYRECDEHGLEGIFPEKNFLFYRYKRKALMIYGPKTRVWEMAIQPPVDLEDIKIFEKIFIRYLSLVFSHKSIIGFWGYPWEDGFHLQRSHHFLSDAFFIDLKQERFIYRKEIKPYTFPIKFYIQDSSTPQNMNLSKEELLSLLLSRTSYFDYYGYPPLFQSCLKTILNQSQAIKTSSIKEISKPLEKNLSN
jgi:hypothetical protein